MTDYNDGQPHIWHGGECPVHPRTEVKIWFRSDLRPNPAAWAGGEDWMHTGRNSDIIAFQVTKPYVEQVDDSQPAVSVPPDISLRIRNLLCKAIDDLENDRGVDLIELERLCILAASQPATDLAAIREAALQARIEELLKERDEYKAAAAIWQEDFIQENQRLYVATVKLAIAVEGLHKIAEYTHIGEGGQGVTQNAEARIASAVLAELEGL